MNELAVTRRTPVDLGAPIVEDPSVRSEGTKKPTEVARRPRAPVPPRRPGVGRRALWLAYKAFVHTLFEVEVKGELPKGGAVLASNHPSMADGPAAVAMSPRIKAVARPQKNKFLMSMIELGGSVITNMPKDEVDANGQPYPRRSYLGAIQHLREGNLLWIAAEGQMHSHKLFDAKSGSARLAHLAGVPVVPVVIRGSDKAWDQLLDIKSWRPWRRPKITIELGEPIQPTADAKASTAKILGTVRSMQEKSGQTYTEVPWYERQNFAPAGLGYDNYMVTAAELGARNAIRR